MKPRLALLGFLVGLGVVTAAEPAPPPRPVPTDAYGDPLPRGAKFRLGTSRYMLSGYAETFDGGPANSAAPLALSPDGRRYAVSDLDTVTVYSTHTGQTVWSVSDESARSGWSIAFSADNRWVATTGRKGTAKWEAATGRVKDDCEADFLDPPRDATSTATSPDGKIRYTATSTGVQAVNAATGAPIRRYDSRETARGWVWLSPDGQRVASSGPGGDLDLWDTASGKLLGTARRPASQRWKFARFGFPTPVGTEEGWYTVVLPEKGPLAVIATLDARRVRIESMPAGAIVSPAGGHRTEIAAVGFTRDGREILTASAGQVVRWDTANGKEIGPVGVREGELVQLKAVEPTRSKLVISPDGRFVAAYECEAIALYEVPTGKQRFVLATPESRDCINSAAFYADGTRLAAGIGERVFFWDTATGRAVFEQRSAPGPDEEYVVGGGVALSPDGSRLVWGLFRHKKGNAGREGDDVSELTSWDLVSGKRISRGEHPKRFFALHSVIDPNLVLLTGPGLEGLVRVWDLTTGKFVREFRTGDGSGAVVSPDGKLVACFEWVRDVKGETDYFRIAVCDWVTGKLVKQLFGPPIDGVRCLAFSSDGKWLVTGHNDSTALVWEIAALPPG